MKVKIQNYDDVTVVELQGELDSDSTQMFVSVLTEAISDDRVHIVLDMSDVGFIDSKGLEKLLWAKDYCNEKKAELRLAGLDENCCKILEITRLEDNFESYSELAEAVKSFA